MTRPAQRGAALLIAMLILTLVATVAAAMVWHQQRAIEIEAAERARTQAAWMLNGGIDLVRQYARLDAQKAFHRNLPWAQPLEEARISTFLAADRDNTVDSSLDAYISGQASDAQDRYNLRRLIGDDGKPVAVELAALRRLCQAAGLSAGLADQLTEGLAAAWSGQGDSAAVAPQRFAQLAWLGLDSSTLAVLGRYVTVLPTRTPVNANTAPAVVLVAAVDGLDLAAAEGIVQSVARNPLDNVARLRALVPATLTLDEARIGVHSRFLEVRARMRLDERVVEDQVLLERSAGARGNAVLVRWRERRVVAPGAG